jgi:hypothetical protein
MGRVLEFYATPERAFAARAAHLTPIGKRNPGTHQAVQPLRLESSLAPPWRASSLQPPHSCLENITTYVINQACGSFRASAGAGLSSHPVAACGAALLRSIHNPIRTFPPSQRALSALRLSHGHQDPPTAVTHVAIVEQLDGKAVDWMEKVTDKEYSAATRLDSQEGR